MKVNRSIEDIRGNKKIIRYFDFEKFLDLLINKRLFLTRADYLTDKYEINLPLENQEQLKKFLSENLPGQYYLELKIDSINNQISNAKQKVFISSWTIDTDESFALWKIYLDNARVGVVLSTTVSKLEKSIIGCQYDFVDNLFLRSVSYKNHIRHEEIFNKNFDLFNIDKMICNKSRFYKYENEARLYAKIDDKKYASLAGAGFYVNIDPSLLIEEIIISPFVKSWARDSFKHIILQNLPNIKGKIKYSKILDV